VSDFVEDVVRKAFETSARMVMEDSEAVLAYYEMTEEEREEYDRKVMNALFKTMSDGLTTAQRKAPE
jgi:hypothetical protein